MANDNKQSSLARTYAAITGVIILAVAAVLIVWDLLMYKFFGGPATESTQVGLWYAMPVVGYLIVAISGGLAGHLLAMVPTGSPHQWLRIAIFVVSFVVLYLYTLKT